MSVERITIPDVRIDKNTIRRSFVDAEKVKECVMEIYWRLKEIEDIIADTESEDYDLDRLKKLVVADRAGRCEIVPEVVYQVDSNGRVYPLHIRKIVYDAGDIAFDKNAIGKRVFPTPEAAEAALKGRCQNENF